MSGPSETADRSVRLTLHYDGAGFHGWQSQPDVRTVQDELEGALSRLTARPTRVVAAGRTDAGVHAGGQVASALVPVRWTPAELRRALNAVLPSDIWVAEAVEADLAFHARFDATAREYEYRVGTAEATRSPFQARWCWPLGVELDAGLLAAGAAVFEGEHAFRAFAKAGQPERGERCAVALSEWRRWSNLGWTYHVSADRFLHHMVRYMVGTMVEAARGRRPVDDIAALLAGADGLETSPPAPPAGLFLTRVHYGPGSERRDRRG